MNEKVTETQIFTHPMFGEVRCLWEGNEPLFIVKDITRALEITNHSRTVAKLASRYKRTVLIETPSGAQYTLAITESGMYSLMFMSRSEQAERFRVWVTDEVLPAIRKTGSYTAKGYKPSGNAVQDVLTLVEVEFYSPEIIYAHADCLSVVSTDDTGKQKALQKYVQQLRKYADALINS